MSDREDSIRSRLSDALAPSALTLINESHKHVGHEGARDGRGHFSLLIVSERFEGLPLLSRHRLVYDALGDLMQTDIHALSLRAIAPSEQ